MTGFPPTSLHLWMSMIFQWCFLKTVLFLVCGGNITGFYSISVKQNLPALLKSRCNAQMSCLIHHHQYYISLVLNSGVSITFIILNANRYLIVWEASYVAGFALQRSAAVFSDHADVSCAVLAVPGPFSAVCLRMHRDVSSACLFHTLSFWELLSCDGFERAVEDRLGLWLPVLSLDVQQRVSRVSLNFLLLTIVFKS